jgi:DNA-binding MarR family transcriptional regulator
MRKRSQPRSAAYDTEPLLGALLRRCHQEVIRHLDAGADELGPLARQSPLLQPLSEHPEGLRITQLAEMAGITKQSMTEFVDGLEAAGYLERVADPTDGRARLVRFTRRGWKAAARARERVREVEARWVERVGAARVEALRATLRAIVAGQEDPAARGRG